MREFLGLKKRWAKRVGGKVMRKRLEGEGHRHSKPARDTTHKHAGPGY